MPHEFTKTVGEESRKALVEINERRPGKSRGERSAVFKRTPVKIRAAPEP